MARVALVLTICILGFSQSLATSSKSNHSDYFRCLSRKIPSQLVLTPSSPSFKPLLVSSIRNARLVAPATASPPLCIVTPTNASHVQDAVCCGRRHRVRVRVRSGGHDNEGLSYMPGRPSREKFAVIDLAKLNGVRVDARAATAWVDSGTTLGELYYRVATAEPGLGFPAGVCPTVGVGGLISGGGMGLMMRKHGLSADNVLDATMVDADGNLLEDKKAMGDDLFWAIRGGGGGNFGIVLSWKLRLVPVPPTVAFFDVTKTIDQGAVDAVTKWQTIAPALPDDLSVRVVVQKRQASFQSLHLGNCSAVVATMHSRFPELGLTLDDCLEMSWLQNKAYLYFGNASNNKPLEELLLNRSMTIGPFVKNKSDYVKKALTRDTWEKIFLWPDGGAVGQLILEPHGGMMSRIAAADTPFPYRSGVLYNVQYVEFWNGTGAAGMPNWLHGLYDFMAPYVSKKPRGAYVNYRDLDIGVNTVVGGVTSYESGKVWGERYFGPANFKRLTKIKHKVDASDYFRNEQSVPPLLLIRE
ncbi:berberine bridge enzyme-like Cyn d 4 [Hordeum vulgare subsp. vulgare]|uniref:FAD-binding PCMH-type domain-containing protein n=1 Tax=Hordeum vulgare subsp. vulgare TaxID=112509 RepID=A0A8I6WQC7_HORVV|nr:berberine bridge enzyme-like Cyn d 4 [Hordeum vulgare subsp. vulgare]